MKLQRRKHGLQKSNMFKTKGHQCGLPFLPQVHMLQLALTHRSVDSRIGRNYNRLEFLGDAFLGFLVDLALIKENVNIMNYLRNDLNSNKTAAKWARITQLSDLINSNIEFGASSKINADAFEAYLGCWAHRLLGEIEESKTRTESAELFDDWETVTRWFAQLVHSTLKQRKEAAQYSWSLSDRQSTESLKAPIMNHRRGPNTPKIIKKLPRSKQNGALGRTFIKLCITLLICENNPMLAEGDLTNLRMQIYKKLSYRNMASTFPFKKTKVRNLNQQTTDCAAVAYLIGTHIESSTCIHDQFVRLHVLKKWIYSLMATKL